MTSPCAPRLSKASGLTQETTVLPASGSAATRSSWPSHGTASTTTSASAQASALAAPVTSPAPSTPVSRARISSAAATAFSAAREPITTAWPWRANR